MKLSKSGIFLIVVLVIAIGLSAWVTVMTCNVLTKEPITTPSRASGGDTPQPVQPIEKPKEPDTLVISMVGDCTLASIQTGRDFDSYIDKNGTSWPFSGVLAVSPVAHNILNVPDDGSGQVTAESPADPAAG